MTIEKDIRKSLTRVEREVTLIHKNALLQGRIFLTAILAFAAALAWHDAVKSVFEEYVKGNTLSAKILYAVIITAAAIVVTILVNRKAERRLHFPHA